MASTADGIVPKAVMMMKMLWGALSLTASKSSSPFIFGIFRSEMMRSKPLFLMTSAAATLSVKVVTSMPSISRIALTASHTLASSSTTIDLNLSMDRQPHRKSRSLPLGAHDLDIAAVFLDDAVAHGQAEPRALECLLGGEKRVEDLVDVFFRDAAAGVGKNDLDGVSVLARDHFDPARRRNGVDRVQEQMHDALADLR